MSGAFLPAPAVVMPTPVIVISPAPAPAPARASAGRGAVSHSGCSNGNVCLDLVSGCVAEFAGHPGASRSLHAGGLQCVRQSGSLGAVDRAVGERDRRPPKILIAEHTVARQRAGYSVFGNQDLWGPSIALANCAPLPFLGAQLASAIDGPQRS